MNEHEKINYIELPSKNIEATKAFFTKVFGWSFTDYGPEYTAFSNEGIDGGFFKSDLTVSTENGSALIVFYSKELEQTQLKIVNAGGSIINHWRPDQVKATKIPILKEDKQQEIKKLVEKSFNNRKLSKSLLEIAKRAVEMAIEEDEKTAINWIDSKIKKLRVKI